MRLALHPKVYSDVDAILKHYESVAGLGMADEFHAELRRLMSMAAERPQSFSIRERDVRRVNLTRFPYHFLFRIIGEKVRILVVRHHRRHPSWGLDRR